MLQTIFLNYADGGSPTNAYSVTLASSDDTYGIKRLDTGAVVVSADTAVSNPSTGYYTYTTDLPANVILLVSWKVIGTNGDQPVYVEEQVGPFASVDTWNAFPEFRGTFSVNTFGTLSLRLCNLDGTPVDPDVISVTVSQGSTPAVLTDTPEKIKQGFYVYEWLIPGDTPTGTYNVLWQYTIQGQSLTALHTIVISAQGGSSSTSNAIVQYLVFRDALDSLIPNIQSIPIYHEQAKVSSDNQTYRFTWGRWNQSASANVYRNNLLLTSGFEIDYLHGTVVFGVPNLPDDVVYADYNFRFFDDGQLERFIYNGINDFNICAPQTRYQLWSLPDAYMTGPLYRAAVNAIRSFRMAMVWPQNRSLFENEKMVDKMFEVMDSDQKAYADEADKNCERKKLFPYVGLTRLVFNDNYALPGGRARAFRALFATGGCG